jgi:hypothetical protein
MRTILSQHAKTIATISKCTAGILCADDLMEIKDLTHYDIPIPSARMTAKQ